MPVHVLAHQHHIYLPPAKRQQEILKPQNAFSRARFKCLFTCLQTNSISAYHHAKRQQEILKPQNAFSRARFKCLFTCLQTNGVSIYHHNQNDDATGIGGEYMATSVSVLSLHGLLDGLAWLF
jgi:hypothetical protein